METKDQKAPEPLAVANLTRELLDYWTARARGIAPQYLWFTRLAPDAMPICTMEVIYADRGNSSRFYRPSTSWDDGGPLIESGRIAVITCGNAWDAMTGAYMEQSAGDIVRLDGSDYGTGPTPLIAVCRAYVASVYGSHVPEVVTP